MTIFFKFAMLVFFFMGCATTLVKKANRETPITTSREIDLQSPFLPSGGPWLTELNKDHTLVGQIWDVHARTFIDQPTLVNRLRTQRFVLLGEKHDNPDHHRLQASLLQAITQTGRKPSMVFEMLETTQQTIIDKQLLTHPKDVDGLAVAVDWEKSDWPEWQQYRPIFAVSMAQNLPIIAANLTRERTLQIIQQGPSVFEPNFVTRYGLDTPLPKKVEDNLLEHLSDVHCGYMPKDKLRPMLWVQRSRDALLADRLQSADPDQGAVLIAGAEHARKDRGVPLYLRGQKQTTSNPSLNQNLLSIVAFAEVSQEMKHPEEYAQYFQAQSLPFDYVWFTPRLENKDYCEELKKQFGPAAHTE